MFQSWATITIEGNDLKGGEIGFVPGSQTATIDEDSVSPTAVLKVQRTKATFGEVQVYVTRHERHCLITIPITEKRVEI